MNEQSRRAAQNSNSINVLSIVKLLLSKFHIILLAGIIFAGVVFLIVSYLVTPTYESRVSFYVYNTSSTAPQPGTINNSDLQAAESLATTYSKILSSNSVLDAVVESVNTTGGKEELERKDLGEMIKVSVITDTQLLEIVVTSADPTFACRIAAAFARVAPKEIVRITKAGGVEVVDRPEVPDEQTSPRRVFDTAVGFIIGAIIASLMLIIRMMSDTKIYLPEDIEEIPGMVILGQIPEIIITEPGKASWNLEEGGEISFENKRKEA